MCHKSTFNLRMPTNLHGVIVQDNGNLDSFSIVKIHQLMLYREIIAVRSQFQTKNTNTLCGQNVEFVNVKPGATCSDHWVLKFNIYYTPSPYRTVNPHRLSYKNQSVNAV